jgi:hypothetical protein
MTGYLAAMSRKSLIETYIAALPLAVVTVVGAGKRCRIHTEGEIAVGEPIQHRFYFKASHAELVLATLDIDGLSGESAAVLAGAIKQAAVTLGAAVIRPDELRRDAEVQVAEIVERVKAASQSGKLKKWNRSYKAYRQAQVAKGEKAVQYAAFIEQFVTTPTVRNIAMMGRMV